jgi:NAD(P)-dependent dehydrogenase (short-subunit alcohol dehydrogenase family)
MVTKTRCFSADDQIAFARLSGDYNAIHVDPVAARRLLFGQPVVHGMHALLWAIDAWLEETKADVHIKILRARFRAAIPLNSAVHVVTHCDNFGDLRFELISDEVKLLTASVTVATGWGAPNSSLAELPPCGPCRNLTPSELEVAKGRFPLCLERDAAGRLFPNAIRHLAPDQFATLLATTRVVGMEAPGLHSVLGGLDLREPSQASGEGELPELTFRTENYDERVSRLELSVTSAALEGKVTAFVRAEPRRQLPFAEIRSQVSAEEFGGEKALVIGGSRGLGEVAVKLLAAGGADVRFTYYRGVADAERLASEIAAEGSVASCFAYDVLADAAPGRLSTALADWRPTLLCYFATPFIGTSTARRFDDTRFRGFCDYYVNGFLKALLAVRALGNSLTSVLSPSTAFVDELPLNMGEYAAAKSAAETLCRFLQKAHPEIRFHCPRLPRLATDQTAGLIRTDLPDPSSVLLAALRDMRSR